MQPALKINSQPWMRAPDTQRVLKALLSGGATARFVGGCVRDAILERSVKDVDIATTDEPGTVMELLKSAGIKAVPTGLEHGTVTAVCESRHFEITTLRQDVETDGRHARVAFTDNWVEDAKRRDFTINAIYADGDGTLYDPVDGIAAVRAGEIKFVGEALKRIDEDVLRILRFFRFNAWFGKAAMDEEGLAACVSRIGALETLAAERVRAELFRLLEAPDPVPTLEVMASCEILAAVLPGAICFERLGKIIRLDGADALLRLAALVSPNPTEAKSIAKQLRLSNAERDRLINLSCSEFPPAAISDTREARRFLYRQGEGLFVDSLLLAWAASGEAPDSPDWNAMKALPEAAALGSLPVSGQDVLKRGVAGGPEVGELLARVEDWWVAGDFRADRTACLNKLDELIPR